MAFNSNIRDSSDFNKRGYFLYFFVAFKTNINNCSICQNKILLCCLYSLYIALIVEMEFLIAYNGVMFHTFSVAFKLS